MSILRKAECGANLFGEPDYRGSITRCSLIRGVYRSLINSGRTYAGFKDEGHLVSTVSDRGEIFDPMSGYGGLSRYCSAIGVNSYCVELNLPQYLWQVLCHPANASGFLESIRGLSQMRRRWPKERRRAIVSKDWFCPEATELLSVLLGLAREAVEAPFGDSAAVNELAAALLLPFVARLSCSVEGNVATHTKQGGMCVFTGWEEDFEAYLGAMARRVGALMGDTAGGEHVVRWGDARSIDLPDGRFRAMVTSPPYPNRCDYVAMFAPEHTFLVAQGFEDNGALPGAIGSTRVADHERKSPKSSSAREFIEKIRELSVSPRAQYQDRTYYVPYYSNYFAGLEDAYSNISRALADDFEGFVVVVNNSHRSLVVPVCQAVCEIWTALGFNVKAESRGEFFHIGTKNPRARGFRARHTEYVVRVWR